MEETLLTQTWSKYPNYSVSFSNKLLKILLHLEDVDSNIVVSPARLQAVLVLIATWASPAIRRQILNCISSGSITIEQAQTLSSCKLLEIKPDYRFKSTLHEGSYPIIELNTHLWVRKNHEVHQEAIDQVIEDYPLFVTQVDFSDPSLKTVIDHTISEVTHGLIKELNMEIGPRMLALITDILYYKAAWDNPFTKSLTRRRIFHGTQGDTLVHMMKNTLYIPYGETPIYQMVYIPYACFVENHVSFSMRIYLPKKNHTILDVLNAINSSDLSVSRQDVKLSLPRFSVSSSLDGKQILTDMGLSYILEDKDIIPSCIPDLKISKVVQQVKVDVNETGTKAAVVNSLGGVDGCDYPFKPIIMRVNKPFIFEIVEDKTNTVLFAGIIHNIGPDSDTNRT